MRELTDRDYPTHVKLHFTVEEEDRPTYFEGVWAVPVEQGYMIENIPFYAMEVACNDVVSAELVDGLLNY